MLLVPRCNSHSLIFSLFVLPLLLVPLLDLCQLAPHAEAAVLNCSAFAPPPSSSAQTHNNQRRGASNATGTHERHYEARLHRCFQANPYDTSQLPVDEDAVVAPFKIGYRFAVDRLQAENIRADVVATGSLYLWWTDSFRTWNLSEIPLDSLVVPVSEIWTPTLLVVRPLSADIELSFDANTRARVSHNGSVNVALRGQYTAFCEGQLRYFPFDKQNCSVLLAFGHQRSSEFVISNTSEPYDTSNSEIKSDKYGVLGISDHPHEFNIRDEGLLPGFVLSLQLKRNPLFHIYNIFIPVFMLTAINIFTMFPEPVDRLNFAAMLIIGFPMLQGRAEIAIPEYEDPPPIADYIAASYMLAALNLLFCSILCYYEKQPDAALSRLFSAPFCLPVHCGETGSTRVLKQVQEERRAVASRRERLRDLLGRQTNPELQKNSDLNDAVVVVTTSSSRTTSENGAEPAVVQDEALSKAHHNVCGKDLSTIESGISMRTFAPTASSQAILDSSTAEAGRAGHPALTLAEETIGRQDEKLEVPNNADLAALRHRYAFSSLKFVLGMANFGMTVWLIVKYEVWPMVVTAMDEIPIFGWSLLLFSVGSGVLYVFESTVWPWYRELAQRHWHFLDGCRAFFMRLRYSRQRATTNTDL